MKNKRLALKLLAKDCQIKQEYLDGKSTCAVGCLALAAGVSREELFENNLTPIINPSMREIAKCIEAKFGLSLRQLHEIQDANDGEIDVKARRKAVLKVVKAIPAT